MNQQLFIRLGARVIAPQQIACVAGDKERVEIWVAGQEEGFSFHGKFAAAFWQWATSAMQCKTLIDSTEQLADTPEHCTVRLPYQFYSRDIDAAYNAARAFIAALAHLGITVDPSDVRDNVKTYFDGYGDASQAAYVTIFVPISGDATERSATEGYVGAAHKAALELLKPKPAPVSQGDNFDPYLDDGDAEERTPTTTLTQAEADQAVAAFIDDEELP